MTVIEAAVKEGNQTPYYLNLDGTRKAYIRSGNESVPTAKRWYKLPSYRLNFPEYAERAIEETCINHLIHRDMAVKGSEVHIDIYDDRIEFYSPGGMLDGTRIQDQDYRKVASKRRNPILAEVFSQLDYMEKRGSGLKKIVSRTESLAAYTQDKTPYFRSDSSSFFTIIPNVNYGLTDADFQRQAWRNWRS